MKPDNETISKEAREAFNRIVEASDAECGRVNGVPLSLNRSKNGREVFLLPEDVQQAILTATAQLREELAQEKKWKEEDPRMLREQIRVADIAFNNLNEENKQLREELERVKRVQGIKDRQSLANNLCPDHRDKQQNKACLACEIEYLHSRIKELEKAVYISSEAVNKTSLQFNSLKQSADQLAEALGSKILGKSLRDYMFEQFPTTDGHIPFMQFCVKQMEALSTYHNQHPPTQ